MIMRNISVDINLLAIRDNYIVLKRFTGKNIAAVIKNNAYNMGVVEVFKILADVCDNFFVATLAEAMVLKPYIAKQSIYILSDNLAGKMSYIIENGFVPVANSVADYQLCKGKCDYVLNVDIGMSRTGLSMDQMQSVKYTGNMRYLMGHLSNSSNVQRTQYEVNNFIAAREMVPDTKTSLAASSSIDLPVIQNTDLLRIGALLYGLEENKRQLRNVLTVKSKVLHIFDIKCGDCIGYGNTYTATCPMKIATVCIGYGFGLPVQMSNGGYFVIKKIVIDTFAQWLVGYQWI